MIDPGLATERRIDLRDDRRRHLHQRYTAQKSRRRKSRQVANHAAAEREDRAATVKRGRGHAIIKQLERRERLRRFARRHRNYHRRETALAQRVRDPRGVQLFNRRVGDDSARAGLQSGVARQFANAVDNSSADVSVMRRRPEFYADCLHGRYGRTRRAATAPKFEMTLSAS